MRHSHGWLILCSLLLLAGCGGGGGDRVSGVTAGPTEPGVPVTPPTPVPPAGSIDVSALASSASLTADIATVAVNSPLSLQFSVVADGVQTVTGLTTSHVRFSLARLEQNEGEAKGEQWVSYINRTEDPVCRTIQDVEKSTNACSTFSTETDPELIPDSARKVQDPQATGKRAVAQATTENNGVLSAGSDGTFTYVFATDLGTPSALTGVHRACIQFSLPAPVANACIDFVPALLADSATAPMGTSLHADFYTTYSGRKIATEASCNSCHANLALHGGGRTQIEYCVACHNPGTVDANSENSLDLKVLVHKLHNGRNLPSKTDDLLSYKIWGYNNGEHDYGNVSYPQSMTNCTRCHAGQEDVDFANAQGLPLPTATLTADGHNWVSNPTLSVCTACHEKLVTQNLKMDGTVPSRDHTGYTEATNCAGCHRDRGADTPGSLQANMAHRDLLQEEGRSYRLQIEAITNAAAGQQPVIDFSVRDADGNAVNLQDNAVFCDTAVFDVRVPWDAASEFLNADSAGTPRSSPRIRGTRTPAQLVSVSAENTLFRIDTALLSTTTPIPAGISNIAVMIDTYYREGCDPASTDYVRLDGVVTYVSTTGGVATGRREIVSAEKCDQCHGRLFTFTMDDGVHGGRRGVNQPVICTACHNPARSGSGSGSTSHDMSVMIHAVHASAMREVPYRNEFDESVLQYPGDLRQCTTCHTGESYRLPLPLERAPMLSNTDVYTTPVAAVCSSCHDSALSTAHMETAGGALFDQPYDNVAAVTETCAICHGEGAAAAVDVVHSR